MSSLDRVLEENRIAVADLIAVAERSAGHWTAPRAPGKWSPAQVTEHVARALDESAKLVAGEPNKFPRLPFFLRPLLRAFLFNRSLRLGGFPKARTSRPFDPASGPSDPAAARDRLQAAAAGFDQACRSRVGEGPVRSATFGDVGLVDYVKFQEIHVRHHTKQIPGA